MSLTFSSETVETAFNNISFHFVDTLLADPARAMEEFVVPEEWKVPIIATVALVGFLGVIGLSSLMGKGESMDALQEENMDTPEKVVESSVPEDDESCSYSTPKRKGRSNASQRALLGSAETPLRRSRRLLNKAKAS